MNQVFLFFSSSLKNLKNELTVTLKLVLLSFTHSENLSFQAVDEHLKETQSQYQTLERKYSKAKRLIKEYQQK